MTSLLFLLKTGAHYSRGATISFGFLGIAGIVASRSFTAFNLRRALANGTLGGQRVIVIGDPEELAIKPKTDLLRTYGAREVGRFELSPASGPTLSNIARDSEVIDSVIGAARASYAEQVLLALRWVDTARTDFVCERLRALPLPVFLLPDRSICVAGKKPRAHDFSSCSSVTRSLRTVNSSTCNAPIRAFLMAKRPIAI